MIWKAVFVIKNHVFEKPMSILYKSPFSSEIKYECALNDKMMTVTITFDAVHVSKPPVLQKEQAQLLFSMLKEISAPFIADNFDAELTELMPPNEKDQKEYDSIKAPENFSFSQAPKTIVSDTIDKIESVFFKVHSSKLVISGVAASEYENRMILTTMLKWYNKSLEYKGIIDKFISLSITFNVIYEYMWRYYKGDKEPSRDSEKILKCIRRTLSKKECVDILKPYEFILPETMPPYELIVTQEELDAMLKHKDLEKIKESHQKFLEKEKKDLGFNNVDCLVNKRGLNFGKYWYVKDWIQSLAQVMVNIYGLRNIVFHSGQIPIDAIEGMTGDPDSYRYWSMVNDILAKVNALLITKILSHFSPS